MYSAYITFHYHSCSIDNYRNVKDVKCQNFGRLGISHLEKERIFKTQPKSWKSFLHILSPTWADLRFPYARGLKYQLPFRGPIRLTNYNFHTHVQYCITIHYHSCSIDKYRTVKDANCHNFGRLGISCFEKKGLQNSLPKVGKVFSTFFPHLSWFEVTNMLGVWNNHLPFRGPIRLTNYNFHTFVQYYITIHYHRCIIDNSRNVKDVKCQNFGRLGISHLEKERFCKTQPKAGRVSSTFLLPTWADLRFPHARGLRYHQPLMGTYQIDKL